MKGAEGNFVKINLKKKSHVKGYALRGVGLRKQVSFVYMCVFVSAALMCGTDPKCLEKLSHNQNIR